MRRRTDLEGLLMSLTVDRKGFRYLISAALAMALVLASGVFADDQIYRSVDEEGRVIFSDEPAEGAKPVELPPTNTMGQPAAIPRPAPAEGTVTQFTGYDSVAIVQPADDESIVNTGGDFSVSVQTTPALQLAHSLRLLLDGAAYASSADGGFSLRNIDRGSHTLQVQVIDEGGAVLAESITFTVYVRRPGRRFPG